MKYSFFALTILCSSILNSLFAQNCGAPIPNEFLTAKILPGNVRAEQAKVYCTSVRVAVERINFLLKDKGLSASGDIKKYLSNFIVPQNVIIAKQSVSSIRLAGSDHYDGSNAVTDSFSFLLSGEIASGAESVPATISVLVMIKNRFTGEVIERISSTTASYDELGRLVPATKAKERVKVKSQASVYTFINISNAQTHGDIINTISSRTFDEETNEDDDAQTIFAKLDLMRERVKNISQILPVQEFEVIQDSR